MADDQDHSRNTQAISVGVPGYGNVGISSEVYGDLLKPSVKPIGEAVGGLVTVLANLVGIPTDYLNANLGPFREKLRERIEAIPPQDRVVPPLRIGCSVLKEVSFAADEPDLQRMFAELLACASDSRKQKGVHPSFPGILSQLASGDALLLQYLTLNSGDVWYQDLDEWDGMHLRDSLQSAGALQSLGLVELKFHRYGKVPLLQASLQEQLRTAVSQLKFKPAGPKRMGMDLTVLTDGIESAVITAIEKTVKFIDESNEKVGIKLTTFGRQFIAACMPIVDAEPTTTAAPNK